MRRALICCAAFVALAHVATAADDPGFVRVGTAPPPGFEHLAEPQLTEVDVWFAGRPLVSVLARYDLDSIEFLDLDALIAAIPRAIDPEALRAALSGPLPTNAERLCAHAAQTDCGTLAPPVAAVLFDEGRFRADLFVHRLQLEAQTLQVSRFLPPASSRTLSTVHLFGLSASGGGDTGSAFDLGATSLVALGEQRARAEYDVSDDGFALRELAWQRDRAGYRYEAGLLRSGGRGGAFVTEPHVLGVRAGTALDLRADLDSAEGTPIFLFLSQRSRVDVFRGERLIDSRFYEGGNQQLDTTRLPDGAYDITVRILGDDGRERHETYFFMRTALLPPRDQPLYYAELGRLTDAAPDLGDALTDGAWARAGTARRLHERGGVEAELVHAGGTSLLQAGAFVFGPGWQMRASAMGGGDGSSGAWLAANWRHDALALGLDVRRVRAGDGGVIADSYTQGTFTLTAALGGGRLAVRTQLDRRAERAASLGWGATFSRPVYRRGAWQLDLDLDAAAARDDRLLRVGVQARWRGPQRFASVRPMLEHATTAAGSDTRVLLDARTTFQRDSERFGRVTRNAYAVRDAARTVLGAGAALDATRGRASLDAQYVSGETGSHLAWSANGFVALAAGDGELALGGRRHDSAGVIVAIDAPADANLSFDVLVDEQLAGTARGGARTAIALPPYRTYGVRLAPRGDQIVQIDERTHPVTLYPGNVHVLRYAPRELTVLVGQALWPDGTPVAHARFANVEGLGVTDERGWFQVEVTTLAPLRLRDRARGECVLPLGDVTVEQGLAVLAPLTCEAPATP